MKAGDMVALKPEVLKGVQELYREKPEVAKYFAKTHKLASMDRGRGKINYPKALGAEFTYWYVNEGDITLVKSAPTFKGSCGCNWKGCKKEHAA